MATLSSVISQKPSAPMNEADPQVVVVEEDAIALSRLVTALADVGHVTPMLSLDELVGHQRNGVSGLVIVLGPSQMNSVALDRVGAILQADRLTGALLVIENADPTSMRIALKAGLDDAIDMENVELDLPTAVRELAFRLPAAPVADAATPDPTQSRRCRFTTVFSPKGGVGTSVVAVNLATSLARQSKGRVAIVDLDANFGDVAVMLRLKPAHTLGEAVEAGSRLDSVLLGSLLVRDDRSGLEVLAAPSGSTDLVGITAQSVALIFDVMRSVFEHVIVDTASELTESTIEALKESDDIVYVVGMDVPSIKNARLGIQAFEYLDIPLENMIIILNRSDSRVHLEPRDVEKSLQMKVDVSLPSDALVPQSVNTGIPAVLDFERSRFAGRIREVAAVIADRISKGGR